LEITWRQKKSRKVNFFFEYDLTSKVRIKLDRDIDYEEFKEEAFKQTKKKSTETKSGKRLRL